MNVTLVNLVGSYMKTNVLIHAQNNIMVKIKYVTHVTQLVKHVMDQIMENVSVVLTIGIFTKMDVLVLKIVMMDTMKKVIILVKLV